MERTEVEGKVRVDAGAGPSRATARATPAHPATARIPQASAPETSALRALLGAYAERSTPHRVAVVGNAPLAPDPERAAAVDGCDLVIRVNGFVLDEPDAPATVGSTVHVVVFNRALRATPWVFRDYRRRLYLLVEPGRLHWEPEDLPGWWPPDLGFVPVPNREFTLPLSSALGLPTRQQALWSTTGTMAAWIGRTMFPDAELLLTGFSFVDRPDQTFWHHASGDSCPVGPEHRIAHEKRLLDTWTGTGRARLLR